MATKPRHLKTPLQLWIVDNRKRLGLTPADLARLTDVTPDTARGWESRGAPSADALAILVRTFGVPLPEEQQGYGDASLAAAVLELTGELRAWRVERESTEARLRAVEAELESLRARPAAGASSGRSVPLGTAG